MANTYQVVRRERVGAPPSAVYAQLVDFHRWQAWSPWEGLDASQQRTYSGPAAGVGAMYAWQGNRKVGQGAMEITRAEEPARVAVDIHFIKPFKSEAESRFDIEPDGDGSTVTWTMEGPVTFATRVMSLVKSMDALLGPDFEKGLARLKLAAEAETSAS